MLSDAELDAILARADAATDHPLTWPEMERWMSTAPVDIRALLAEVRRLRKIEAAARIFFEAADCLASTWPADSGATQDQVDDCANRYQNANDDLRRAVEASE